MSNIQKRFMANLARHMEGRTIVDVAMRAKTSQGAIHNLLDGTGVPTIELVERLAKALNVEDPLDLLR